MSKGHEGEDKNKKPEGKKPHEGHDAHAAHPAAKGAQGAHGGADAHHGGPQGNHGAHGGAHKGPKGKAGPGPMPGGCTSWGCKAHATRFNFCDEHYDHFKFGLIKKTGEPVSDYEKKFEHYMAHKAKAKKGAPKVA